MSREIDERIVSMRFDNSQFESNARATMKTLDEFDAKLEFKNASRGVENVNKAANSINLSGLSQAAEAVEVKFSAMSVVAMSALDRIVNKAMDAGVQLIRSLTVAPISQGFNEYELKLKSVQTIMASTGASLEEVNGYLDELNTYADKTIYSFADMTQNIGKFTNAGVPLKDAVAAIQGIANEAALSGANAQEASRAMYNFAQALSAGYVKLIDWKSIEVANMATKGFKEELIKTAVEVGTLTQGVDGMYNTLEGHALNATKNFNETLQDQWMTTEVLTKTLAKYASETEGIGQKAFAAATEVKSVTQLLDTLKEAVGSGWAKSFELIIGDFNEAKELWTSVSNAIGGVIDAQAKQRNEILQSWRDFGGREALIQSFANMWEALLSIIKPVRDAIHEIFPVTGEGLANLTKGFQRFTESLKLSDEAAYTLKVILKVLLLPLKALFEVIKVGVAWLSALVQICAILINRFLGMWATGNPIKDLFKKIFGEERYAKIATALSTAVSNLVSAFKNLGARIKEAFTNTKFVEGMKGLFQQLLSVLSAVGGWVLDRIVEAFEYLATIDWSVLTNFIYNTLTVAGSILKIVGERLLIILQHVGSIIGVILKGGITGFFTVISKIVNVIADGMEWLAAGFTNISNAAGEATKTVSPGFVEGLTRVRDVIAKVIKSIDPMQVVLVALAGAFVGLIISVSRFVKSFSSIGTAITGVINRIGGVIGQFGGVLKALKTRIKPNYIMDAAKAIVMMAGALAVLSLIEPARLVSAGIALAAIMASLAALTAVLKKLTEDLDKDQLKAINKLGTTMIKISASIMVLAGAMMMLDSVDLNGSFIAKIALLLGVFGSMVLASKYLAKHGEELSKGTRTILSFAATLMIVVQSLKSLASLDISQMGWQLLSLVGMVGTMAIMAKISKGTDWKGAAGLLIIAADIIILAQALKSISKLDPISMLKSIPALVLIVTTIAGLVKATSKSGGHMASAGIGLIGMALAIDFLCIAIKSLGKLDLKTTLKGVAAVSVLLGMFALVNKSSSNISKYAGRMAPTILAMSISILLLSVAVRKLGELSVGDLVKGTLAVGSMLALFALIVNVSKSAKGAALGVAVITGCIILITGALLLMSVVPTARALGAATAMAEVLLAFGVVTRILDKDLKLGTALKSAVLLGLLLSEINTALIALAIFSDGKSAIANATAISECLLSIALTTRIIRGIKDPKQVLKSVLVLGVMIAEIVAALGVMSNFDSADAIVNATALSEAVLALGLITIALGNAGFDDNDKIQSAVKGAVAMDAVGALVVALVALFGVIASADSDLSIIDRGVQVVNKLGDALPGLAVMGIVGAFSAAITKLLGSNPMGSLALLTTGGVLEGLGAAVVGILALFGLIAENFDSDLSMIDKGVEIMKKVGTGFGEAIGGFFGGMAESFTEHLGEVGANLSEFMTEIEGFVTGVRDIDEQFLTGVTNLSAGIIKLTAADVISGLGNFISGGNDFEDLATSLTSFIPVMEQISNTVKSNGINVYQINQVAEAMEGFGAFIAAIPKQGGAWQAFFGEVNLSTFGEDMSNLAAGICDFANQVSAEGIDASKITEAANAAQLLADLENSLPPKDGVLQYWTGEKDLGVFGGQLKEFGEGLSSYANSVDGVDNDKVTSSANAAQCLVDLATAIPSQGTSLYSLIMGEKDLGTFGQQLNVFGLNLKVYSDYIGKMDKTAFDYTDDIADLIKKLGDAVEPHFGLVQSIVGDKSLGLFALELGAFAKNFKTYADYVTQITDWDTVERSATIGSVLAGICPSLISYGGAFKLFTGQKSLTFFGEDLAGFAPGLKDFVEDVKDVSSSDITQATNVIPLVESLIGMLDKFKGEVTGGIVDTKIFGVGGALINGIGDAIQNRGKSISGYGAILQGIGEGLSSFVGSLSGIETSKLESANANLRAFINILNEYNPSTGENLNNLITQMTEAVSGFIEAFGNADEISIAVKTCVDTMVSTFGSSDIVESFTTIGKDSLGKLLAGFEEKHPKMDGSITILITNITNGFKSEANTAKFVALGKYVVEGVVKGINDNTGLLDTAGTNIGESVATATESDLGIESPSKRFAEIAGYCIEGLLVGIRQNGGVAEEAGVYGANQLLEGATEALSVTKGKSEKFEEVGSVAAKSIADGAEKNDGSVIDRLLAFGILCANSIANGLATGSDSSNSVLTENARQMVSVMENTLQIRGGNSEVFTKVGENIVDSVTKPIEEKKRPVWEAFSNFGSSCVKGISYGMALFKEDALNTARDQAIGLIAETESVLKIQKGVSASFKMVGETVANGLIDGIEAEEPDLANAVDSASKVILATAEDYFGIHGSNVSITMKDGIGKVLVKGIAEGITSEMSAEEAASKKAENIAKAFEEGLQRAATEISLSEAYQKMWELENPNASESEVKQHQIDSINEQLKSKGNEVNTRYADWQALVEEFGKTSSEAMDAELKWVNSRNEMLDLANSLLELEGNGATNMKENQDAYFEYLQTNYETLKKMGYMDEEIKAAARERSGYDPRVSSESGTLKTAKDIVDQYMANVEITIDETMPQTITQSTTNAFQASVPGSSQAASQAATQIAQSYEQTMNDELQNMNITGIEPVDNLIKSFVPSPDSAAKAVNDAVDAAGDSMSSNSNRLANIAQMGVDCVKDYLGMHSPSTVFYDIGKYCIIGLVNGFAETMSTTGATTIGSIAEEVINAFSSTEETTPLTVGSLFAQAFANGILSQEGTITYSLNQTFSNVVSNTEMQVTPYFTNSGTNMASAMMDGLIAGIDNASSGFIMKVQQVAISAYNAAMAALNAHSPSRKFIYVGEMCIAGFVKGLEDNQKDLMTESSSVGQSVVDATTRAVELANRYLENDPDLSPTITPVLDLSQVETSASTIGSLFNTGEAMRLNAEITNARLARSRQNDGDDGSSGAPTYNFTQNNYSPKALSKVDIYRQTRNQFSRFRQEVTR